MQRSWPLPYPHNMKQLICSPLFVLALMLNQFSLEAQTKVRKLPSSINHPSLNLYAPYLSADANAIVFISDNGEDNALTPFYTSRESADWKEPQMLPKSIYTRLNFLKGFALSADGKKLFFSTIKSPSVGVYDIWSSELKGTTWSEPVNLGMPVNSKGNEACPSLSVDGTALYFMRCEKMDQNKAEQCKIFKTTKKPNGQWDEPVELPAHINTGNSQTPRIMADGETLIFSSDKMPVKKGGMDLYITKFANGNWSQPVPLDFVNTDKDDQYVSVAALGRYLVKDAMGQRKNELMEYLIPDQLRPKGMMKIEGKVTDPTGKAIPAYVSLMDLNKKQRVLSTRPNADGTFLAYVMEGSKYELSIDPEQDNVTYYTKQFDLTSDKIPQVEKVSVVLKPLAVGDEINLDGIVFELNSSDVDATASAAEAKRFLRVVKANPNFKFEIQVMLSGYKEDSVRSNPDLTEVLYDSIHMKIDDIDSLGQLYKKDTVWVKTTFHNDRTWNQAAALVKYLVSQGGGSESNFTTFGNAIPAPATDQRKITVKAVARPKK